MGALLFLDLQSRVMKRWDKYDDKDGEYVDDDKGDDHYDDDDDDDDDDVDDDDDDDDYRICPIVLNKGCVVLFLVQPFK